MRGGTPGAVNSPATLPDPSQPGDVVINEIMANPTGLTAFPETEYVELFNTAGKAVSLGGWSFVYDGRAAALPDTLLPPGAYAVLFREGREIVTADGGQALPVSAFPALLANDGKSVKLVNSAGVTIDTAVYAAATAACSWERSGENRWHLSNDPRGGTPGAANSPERLPARPEGSGVLPDDDRIVYEGDVIFNEILAEPFPGGSEYIELCNRSGRTLRLSLLSIATRRTDGALRTLYPLASLTESLTPNGYMALTGRRDGVLNFYTSALPDAICEVKLPELANSGASLVLCRTRDSIVIDEAAYTPGWHDGAIKNVRGVSLERIRTDAPTQDATNWTSATSVAGYGTPGGRNSQTAASGEANPNRLDRPEYVPERDEYVIPFRFDRAGYRVRIDVYMPEGRKVAEIANNRLVGQEGEIRWDGRGLSGDRLPPDVYVFHVEYYHPEGQRNFFKKAFIVRK
jgi:hypothetical protein